MCTSIGALCDDDLFEDLEETARSTGGRLLLASGAMPGLDWMRSSALGSSGEGGNGAPQSVRVIQSKPPSSWKGARYGPGAGSAAGQVPLPDAIDFDRVDTRTVIFEGSAREAATQFPKNSNVCAAVALATVGLDRARVELVADPVNFGTVVEYSGSAGTIRLDVKGKKSAGNVRTSAVVPLSVIKALQNLSAPVAMGV